jgi:hypothetical protein
VSHRVKVARLRHLLQRLVVEVEISMDKLQQESPEEVNSITEEMFDRLEYHHEDIIRVPPIRGLILTEPGVPGVGAAEEALDDDAYEASFVDSSSAAESAESGSADIETRRPGFSHRSEVLDRC